MKCNEFQEKIVELKNFLLSQGLEIIGEEYSNNDDYYYQLQFILLNKKVNVNLTKYDFETLAINFSYLQTQNHIWEYNNPIIGYSILNIPEDKTLFQNAIEKGFNFFRNILESYFIEYKEEQ